MKKRIISILLVLFILLGTLPMAAFAAACTECQVDGSHLSNCRLDCPTPGCTVTKDGDIYTHSVEDCPYKDENRYCPICGYLENKEGSYVHASTCRFNCPIPGCTVT